MGVCSHSVAVVEWLKKTKKAPNLTKLVTAKMPKGRGQKGCVPPRKRRKKVAIHSRKSFAEVLEEQAPTEELHEARAILMILIVVVMMLTRRSINQHPRCQNVDKKGVALLIERQVSSRLQRS